MSRCVMVLGVPRSGTSAVAGVLHALGVDMGTGHLQKGNQWNERGYVEDVRWQKLNKRITGERYGHNQPKTISERLKMQYQTLAVQCNAASPLWGMKDPRLCFTAHFLWKYLDDARIVAVHRSPGASAESLMRHSLENYGGKYAMTLEQAMDLRDLWAEAMEARLRRFWGPVLRIQYEELLDRPEERVDDLARFAFQGLSLTPDRAAGVRFLDPGLKHYD